MYCFNHSHVLSVAAVQSSLDGGSLQQADAFLPLSGWAQHQQIGAYGPSHHTPSPQEYKHQDNNLLFGFSILLMSSPNQQNSPGLQTQLWKQLPAGSQGPFGCFVTWVPPWPQQAGPTCSAHQRESAFSSKARSKLHTSLTAGSLPKPHLRG